MTKCDICGRDVEEKGFCRYHHKALNNLREAFEGWSKASGVSWGQYLDRLMEIEETGHWVKEVIEYLS